MQLFFVAATLLFLFKVFYGNPDSIYLKFIFDLLIGVSIFFLILALIRFENSRSSSPLSLGFKCWNIAGNNVFYNNVFRLSVTSIFENINLKLSNPGLVENIVSLIYVLILVGIISFFLVMLRHFFYLNQTKNTRIYFNTMVVFFILASISLNFFNDESLSFLITTFFVVSVF